MCCCNTIPLTFYPPQKYLQSLRLWSLNSVSEEGVGKRVTGGNCGWIQEDAFLEIPYKCKTSQLTCRFPTVGIPLSEKFPIRRDGWSGNLFLFDWNKIPAFPNEVLSCNSVSQQPISLTLCSAQECQRKVVTHTTHTHTQVAGVGGLWQRIVGECWGIYLTGKLLCVGEWGWSIP